MVNVHITQVIIMFWRMNVGIYKV